MKDLINYSRPKKTITKIYGNQLYLYYCKDENLVHSKFKQLDSSIKISKFLRSIWDIDELTIRESFYLICLSPPLDIVGFYKISEGGWDAILVDLRLLFSVVLLCKSHAIIIAHNHPSGTISPSDADRELTKKIIHAAEILSIKVLDHLILTENNYYSFRDQGDI